MGKRGRPLNSIIRRNIIEILYFLGKGYGYDIYKVYREIFPKVTMRSIYYHLNKGRELGIFKVEQVQQELGDYSWGAVAEKTYYSLGKNANPRGDIRVKNFLENVDRTR